MGRLEVETVLGRVRQQLDDARSMPVSASVLVNRSELLGLLEELERAVAEALAESDRVLGEREVVIEEGRARVEELLAEARLDRERMVSDTEVYQGARQQADSSLAEVAAQAEETRRGADEYVDARLANFEITLHRTLEAVRRGREQLASGAAVEGVGPGWGVVAPGADSGEAEAPLPDHLR